jgi:hypothetical protein
MVTESACAAKMSVGASRPRDPLVALIESPQMCLPKFPTCERPSGGPDRVRQRANPRVRGAATLGLTEAFPLPPRCQALSAHSTQCSPSPPSPCLCPPPARSASSSRCVPQSVRSYRPGATSSSSTSCARGRATSRPELGNSPDKSRLLAVHASAQHPFGPDRHGRLEIAAQLERTGTSSKLLLNQDG